MARRTAAPVEPRRALAQPALSPDGSEVAFVSGDDIWAAPARGGVARLLVSHEATESRPLYSPDGARLAFVSDRAGSDDLYVLELGVGNGNQAKVWLDEFVRLDREHGFLTHGRVVSTHDDSAASLSRTFNFEPSGDALAAPHAAPHGEDGHTGPESDRAQRQLQAFVFH